MSKISKGGPMGNINVFQPQDLAETSAPGGGMQVKFDYDPASVRLLKYPAGSEIPRHIHKNEALHIIGSGSIKSVDGSYELGVGAMYKCGMAEYGPWLVIQDLEMYVIEV